MYLLSKGFAYGNLKTIDSFHLFKEMRGKLNQDKDDIYELVRLVKHIIFDQKTYLFRDFVMVSIILMNNVIWFFNLPPGLSPE